MAGPPYLISSGLVASTSVWRIAGRDFSGEGRREFPRPAGICVAARTIAPRLGRGAREMGDQSVNFLAIDATLSRWPMGRAGFCLFAPYAQMSAISSRITQLTRGRVGRVAVFRAFTPVRYFGNVA